VKQPRSRAGVHYVLVAVWLAYTISLAAWWLSVGLTLTERRTMFLLEGATFFVVIAAGGLALVIAIRREHSRRQSLETFFMSFTHDLKTALASVQLQAEGLREDWPAETRPAGLDRLLADTVRLQIQLENSLFVAQPDGRLLVETIDVGRAVERLADDWPALQIATTGQAVVLADARAFDAVLRNILQNAVIHGEASRVTIALSRPAPGTVRVDVTDNGHGMPQSVLSDLGKPFVRPGATSGTGVGLYVSQQLVSRMRGSLAFAIATASEAGLRVTIELPEAG
jgi:signal transduction histidine kinase